jgi:hypothetical protein
MPKVHEMIQSKYLRKEDVDGEVVVTVKKFGQVNVAQEDQPEDLKWAVKFAEFKKPMVLNSTNIQLLEKIGGSDELNDCIDKQVTLYVDPSVSFGGKIVGGLRFRLPPKPSSQPPASSPGKPGARFDDMADDVPF